MKKTFLKFFISIIVIVLIIVAVLYISSRFQDISGIVILINDNEIYICNNDDFDLEGIQLFFKLKTHLHNKRAGE